ncbi:MAG: glycosyltransferase family A protein [Nitrososphaerales archaeon]
MCIPTLVEPSSEFEEMIKREIPVNNIIYSYDRPLGVARQRLIESVSTEWFVFVDTDVVLLPGWFEKVWRYVDATTGEGVTGYVPDEIDIRKFVRTLFIKILVWILLTLRQETRRSESKNP